MAKCIAHRGFSSKYPENTLLAFEKAVEAGSHGIEIDVHFSADKVPVIIHDRTLDRTTDARGYVCERTAAELQRVNAAALFPDMPPQPVPTLEQYFEMMHGNDLILNIELKNLEFAYEGLYPAVADMVRRFGYQNRTVLASFNNPAIAAFQPQAPDLKCCFLMQENIHDPVAYLAHAGIRYLQPYYRTITPERAKQLLHAGITLFVWTVDDAEEMRRMAELGAQNIITNRPDVFFEAGLG